MRYLPLLLTVLMWSGEKISHTDSQWLEKLGSERFEVMRKKGTERPFLGQYVYTDEEGTYHCAACDLPLFHSKEKFDAHSGYPSFYKPLFSKNVYYLEDWRLKFKRYEVLCSRCDSHLGHIFRNGQAKEEEKKFRYCINSISINFLPKSASFPP